jgi:putative FmdB family regulatory protein
LPLYDYECKKCGTVEEIRHGFNDTVTHPCAACGGELARKFHAAPIVFKGSGYYVTDSRAKTAAASGESKSETKSDAKPEAAPKPDAKPKSESAA